MNCTMKADLGRMKLLLAAVDSTLRHAARLTDSALKREVNCAFADAKRAQQYWIDGRLTGPGLARTRVTEAVIKLVAAAKAANKAARGELAAAAHQLIISALRDIENHLAECQEEATA